MWEFMERNSRKWQQKLGKNKDLRMMLAHGKPSSDDE